MVGGENNLCLSMENAQKFFQYFQKAQSEIKRFNSSHSAGFGGFSPCLLLIPTNPPYYYQIIFIYSSSFFSSSVAFLYLFIFSTISLGNSSKNNIPLSFADLFSLTTILSNSVKSSRVLVGLTRCT